MSYCVNCGVKLASSEEDCPLCGCPIVNPMKPEELPENFEKPYPKRRDTIKNIVDRQFIISMISILYVLPIVICVTVDIILNGNVTWSLISTAAVLLCWAIIFLPYIIDKELIILYLTIDFALLTALFASIAWYTGNDSWVYILALPIAIVVFVIINLLAYGIHMKILYGLYIGAVVLSSVGVFAIIIELLVWNYKKHYVYIDNKFTYWSLYVFISCIIIAGLLCYIEKKKAIKRGLEKRFHI